jgi:hypothetical protein
MSARTLRDAKVLLLAGSILLCAGITLVAEGKEEPGGAVPPASPPLLSPIPKAAYLSAAAASSTRGTMMYRRLWGVDNMVVRETASGFMLRFSYRVVDANKAKVLNDKKNTPYLIDETTGIKMEVPTMEKVGQLRQVATPEDGREYWMVFSNRGLSVKPGKRVDIVIGNFRINGLVVESAR